MVFSRVLHTVSYVLSNTCFPAPIELYISSRSIFHEGVQYGTSCWPTTAIMLHPTLSYCILLHVAVSSILLHLVTYIIFTVVSWYKLLHFVTVASCYSTLLQHLVTGSCDSILLQHLVATSVSCYSMLLQHVVTVVGYCYILLQHLATASCYILLLVMIQLLDTASCCKNLLFTELAVRLLLAVCVRVLRVLRVVQVPLVREIMAGNRRGKRLLSLDD